MYSAVYRPRGGVEIYRHPYVHTLWLKTELTETCIVIAVTVKVSVVVAQWIGKRKG